MADVDRSDAADARRFRWLLNGNGYFMEENSLCGSSPCREGEQDDAREWIDKEIADEETSGSDR